jgi:SET domain
MLDPSLHIPSESTTPNHDSACDELATPSEVNNCDNLSDVFPDIPNLFRVGIGSKGRGLFATQDIPPRTLIHVAPCLTIVPGDYADHMRYTILEDYLFNDTSGCKMLALGYGSLLNHSQHPNIDYRVDSGNEVIRFSSGHARISEGEELCISYGGNLWFRDIDEKHDDDESSEGDFLGRLGLE